ncbi:hypothetical protein [Propionivibrio dicarboxylicus]|uniref:Lipoprotein n=1 Tax=Propionivibrio dicarboxylicus TaxID=83767 RepID=A0A1G7WK25_9RHOO|nr:hypothetical protein [Propionivibrio dicarboxylicus]SDG72292.1 hypothetical protein SAMN05660652_00546 [Propionivibrio dicarboxylicus]
MSTSLKTVLLAAGIAILSGCAVYPSHGAYYGPGPGYSSYRGFVPPPAPFRGFSHHGHGFRRW